MGEIADMMLEGTLCEGCGVFIDDGAGFRNYCSEQCARDRSADWWLEMNGYPVSNQTKSSKVSCPVCGKRCKGEQGLHDHTRIKHGD